jgi:hypothetical protein
MLGRLRCVGQSSQGNTQRKMARKCQLDASSSKGNKSLSHACAPRVDRCHLCFLAPAKTPNIPALMKAASHPLMRHVDGRPSSLQPARSFACVLLCIPISLANERTGVEVMRGHGLRNSHSWPLPGGKPANLQTNMPHPVLELPRASGRSCDLRPTATTGSTVGSDLARRLFCF